jgi:NitT/TauT family transport system permease protein
MRPSAIRLLLWRARLGVLLIGIVLAWETYTRLVSVPTYLLPSPSMVVEAFVDSNRLVIGAFLVTATEASLGFMIAASAGLLLAVMIARSALLEDVLYPFLNIIRVTPVIAIAPLLTIWFGHGLTPMILVSALIAFFPIVVTTVLGLRSADPELVSLMRTLNASEAEILRKIRMPSALPHLFASFRVSAPLAVIGALVGEFVGASAGMGFLLVSARSRIDTEMVFLMVVLSAILGILAFSAVVALERRYVRWHHSVLSV